MERKQKGYSQLPQKERWGERRTKYKVWYLPPPYHPFSFNYDSKDPYLKTLGGLEEKIFSL